MTQQQREALDEMMRSGPLDIGGDLTVQRPALEQMLTSIPLAKDVRTSPAVLGGVPVVQIETTGASPDALLLYLHGGAYAIGSAASSVGLASDVARRVGIRAITVEYRLAPEHPYPAGVDDALAVYRAILRTTPHDRIVVTGESAGGGLVLALLVAAKAADLPQPAAAVVFSPWVDLSLTGASLDTKAAVDPALTPEGLRIRATDYLGTADPTAGAVSPVFADLSGLPPLLIQAGSHEILLDDAVRLAARAATDDVDVTLSVQAGVPHVFQGFAAVLDEGEQALQEAGRFLTHHLTAPPS